MTLTDFYRKVLEKLDVVAAGEPADPEDIAFVASKYATSHALLRTKDLVSWTASETIPDEAVSALIPVIAFESADEYGDDRQRYADGAIGLTPPSLSERQLRALHARDYVSHAAQSEYF